MQLPIIWTKDRDSSVLFDIDVRLIRISDLADGLPVRMWYVTPLILCAFVLKLPNGSCSFLGFECLLNSFFIFQISCCIHFDISQLIRGFFQLLEIFLRKDFFLI